MPARTDGVMRSGYRWYRWLVFALLALGYLLVYFHRTCPAVVALDIMADLKAGGGLMGILASAYFYPYAVMQIPAGLLSDSWGPQADHNRVFDPGRCRLHPFRAGPERRLSPYSPGYWWAWGWPWCSFPP